MAMRNVWSVILTAAAAALLSACTFSIDKPRDGDIVRAPANTKVILTSNASMSGVAVQVDNGNGPSDVSNQGSYVSDGKWEADLSLPVAEYIITAQANVYCWYCNNRTTAFSMKRRFCVAAATWPSTAPSYTALARGDSLSWAKTSDTIVGVAADAGTPMTRWNLIRVGGISQSIGIIQSTENSCLCMKSMSDQSDTPIGLAICDATDALQQWHALPILRPNDSDHYRFQNFGRGVSSACLTEGPNSVLIQGGCQDRNNQLWRIRDNTNGRLVSPF